MRIGTSIRSEQSSRNCHLQWQFFGSPWWRLIADPTTGREGRRTGDEWTEVWIWSLSIPVVVKSRYSGNRRRVLFSFKLQCGTRLRSEGEDWPYCASVEGWMTSAVAVRASTRTKNIYSKIFKFSFFSLDFHLPLSFDILAVVHFFLHSVVKVDDIDSWWFVPQAPCDCLIS